MAFPGQGYPDWLRTAEWQAQTVLNVTAQSSDVSGDLYGPFFVGQYHSVQLRGTVDDQAHELQLIWTDTNQIADVAGTLKYDISVDKFFQFAPANLGRWLHVLITPAAAGGDHTLSIRPTNRQLKEFPQSTNGGVLLDTTSSSYTTGQSKTFETDFPYHGPAVANVICGINAAQILVRGDRFNGTQSTILRESTQSLTTGTWPLWLPPQRIMLVVVNGNANTQNIHATISCDGY